VGGGKVAIAGIRISQSTGVDDHDGIEPQSVDRRLIVSLDTRQVAGDHGVAGGLSLPYGLLRFHNGRAGHIEAGGSSLPVGQPAMGERQKAEGSKYALHSGHR